MPIDRGRPTTCPSRTARPGASDRCGYGLTLRSAFMATVQGGAFDDVPRTTARGAAASGTVPLPFYAAAIFCFKCVSRSFASLLRTAMAYAPGSPTTKTFFLPRVIAV